MSLCADIDAWDGRETAALREIFALYRHTPEFIDQLANLMCRREAEKGATWLLKHSLENGHGPLTPPQAVRVLKAAAGFEVPEASLHILQSLDAIPIPEEATEDVARFLGICKASRHTFLRAWSFTGWHSLAVKHPRFRKSVSARLKAAEETETAPSVRVRLRKAAEAGF